MTLRVAANLPTEFLLDWSDQHRPMDMAQRDAAGNYIAAIVARDHATGRLATELLEPAAASLWVELRTRYDALADHPASRGANADFARAMREL